MRESLPVGQKRPTSPETEDRQALMSSVKRCQVMRLFLLRACLIALVSGTSAAADGGTGQPMVLVDTSFGDFVITLETERAPRSVAHFLNLVAEKRYDGTIFHRVIPGFMVQGGGKWPDLTDIPEAPTVVSEAHNGLKNLDGTVALARFDDIDSASTEFFVNVGDNAHLDHTPESCTRADYAAQERAAARGLAKPLSCATYGYTVFGRVIDGMETVFDIELVETGLDDDRMDVPLEPVIIRSIRLIESTGAEEAASR